MQHILSACDKDHLAQAEKGIGRHPDKLLSLYCFTVNFCRLQANYNNFSHFFRKNP